MPIKDKRAHINILNLDRSRMQPIKESTESVDNSKNPSVRSSKSRLESKREMQATNENIDRISMERLIGKMEELSTEDSKKRKSRIRFE